MHIPVFSQNVQKGLQESKLKMENFIGNIFPLYFESQTKLVGNRTNHHRPKSSLHFKGGLWDISVFLQKKVTMRDGCWLET